MRKIIFTTVFLLFSTNSSYAIISLDGKKTGPKEHVHHIPDINSLRAKKLPESRIMLEIGSSGIKKVAVIVVSFASLGISPTSGSLPLTSGDLYYIDDAGKFLKDYYKHSSYGSLDLEVTFFSGNAQYNSLISSAVPYELPNSLSYYADKHSQLVKDALALYPGVTYPLYDCVIIAHAGYGAETTDNGYDIWSAFTQVTPPANGFSEGMVVPCREYSMYQNYSGYRKYCIRGVWCHEFGHQLGLPDLYKTTANSPAIVGKWCIMDSGGYVESADGEWAGWWPVLPSAWCKQLLGWITPVELNPIMQPMAENISFAIESVDNASLQKSVYKIPVNNSAKEYYLVYASTFASFYDSSFAAYAYPDAPGEGFVIWHIDDSMGSIENNDVNNYSKRRVDLEEADSDDPSNDNYNYGESTDLWQSSSVFSGGDMSICINNFSEAYTTFLATVTKNSLSGAVKGLDEAGLEGVKVNFAGGYSTFTYTDAGGFFSISLVKGTYNISFEKQGYTITPSAYSVTVSSDMDITQEFMGSENSRTVASGGMKLFDNAFNPRKNESTSIIINLAEAGLVTYNVYTLFGKRIKTHTEQLNQGISGSLSWDGKDDNGKPAASGIYLLHLYGPGINKIGKICVVK
ncbi:MAG: hypothetical protein A3J83_03740 [Elusimicrobia bacterium RIFOXYA2_FULL_40_6]|nr:MAG: hypothetical protein A3J83_03740 [Elusimicrobia bacterium RIFOXYA2_FULL_40_6]